MVLRRACRQNRKHNELLENILATPNCIFTIDLFLNETGALNISFFNNCFDFSNEFFQYACSEGPFHIHNEVCSWLRHYATSWKFTGSIPDVIGFFS
jgi:hypothetical protein